MLSQKAEGQATEKKSRRSRRAGKKTETVEAKAPVAEEAKVEEPKVEAVEETKVEDKVEETKPTDKTEDKK